MLQFGYYEWAPFQIATEAQRRQALFLKYHKEINNYYEYWRKILCTLNLSN